MVKVRWRRLVIQVAVLLAGLIVLGRTGAVLIEWLWFSSIGYVQVFWTIFGAQAVLFVVVFCLSASALFLSGLVAHRSGKGLGPWPVGAAGAELKPQTFTELVVYQWAPRVSPGGVIGGVALLFGLLMATGEMVNWDVALRFLNQVPFGETDPIFGKDISFYVFSLPAYVALKNWLLLLLFCCTVASGAVYWLHGDIELDQSPRALSPAVIAHSSALLGIFFALKAWSYGLDRFLLLFGDNGVVVGAAYTDVHLELPMLWGLVGLAAAASVVSWANIYSRSYALPTAVAVLVFGGSLVAFVSLALFQRLYVKPSELQLETPYIEHNIALTRRAYGLEQIAVKQFPAEQGLSFASLEANRSTIDNIRLWDQQPLMDTYAQLQEIRTYYKFLAIDVDRYRLEPNYQQVMLSARELQSALLPPNAQTWVNLHLLFTHGNGIVMSPVTHKTGEGLPAFYLQDIPPIASGGPTIREPRLYFGEGGERYVIVKGSIPEFDYPKGKDNVYTTYSGRDGILIDSMARRSLFAWQFNDPNILLTSYITGESRILLHRNIQDRVRTIAPFLKLDHDPYMVASEGRLFWMQDGYTTTQWFPYAQPNAGGDLNYMRNAVKAVIDAYNGTVDFYVSDPDDPILRTYQRIFTNLFKPLTAMPEDLQQHIRYPEDLFLIQAKLYRAYHMDAPEVFYNREDLWQLPRKLADLHALGAESNTMAPYYMIMRLPGETRAEFVLMLPMVPSQRENMIAWLAARCDPPHYGKLIVYAFPKEKLVFGPFQIEARIQQNTEISQQISLWNQMGSRVIRGHLVVVPIENSILYVSPLYLRAQSGQLPELKRVIAAYGDRVVMEETLGAALAALFKQTAPAATPFTVKQATGPLARQALDHYDRALERLKAGDWSGFGMELDALRPLLNAIGAGPEGQK